MVKNPLFFGNSPPPGLDKMAVELDFDRKCSDCKYLPKVNRQLAVDLAVDLTMASRISPWSRATISAISLLEPVKICAFIVNRAFTL